MSKTYKTDPTWVKLRRPSWVREEFHNHEDGVCNFDEWFNSEMTFYPWRFRACGYTVSYYGYHGGFYSRPRRNKWHMRYNEGQARAKWRKQRHDMLKLDREGVEDYDVKSYRHRHSALWEVY